ncbi:MAG: hypothetical protein V8Q57_09930 [Blautia sp.]
MQALFSSLAYASYVNYNCSESELAQYGLDKPYAEITVDYQEEAPDEENTEDVESADSAAATDDAAADDVIADDTTANEVASDGVDTDSVSVGTDSEEVSED